MPLDLRSLAREGARRRMHELRTELAILERSFPELSTPQPSRPRASGAAKTGNGRTPMSAAQRKAVGIRMKAYWAARRKAASKKTR